MYRAPNERLREARAARYDSAAAACRAFAWKKPAYTHHENGTMSFGVDEAQRYGRAFGVSWVWLLTGVDPEQQAAAEYMARMSPESRQHALRMLRALSSTDSEEPAA